MAIVEPLPETVQAELHRIAGQDGETKLAVSTDIDGAGKFGERWLVATKDTAYVFLNENGKAELLHEVPLKDIEEVNAEFLVGSGVLEVGVGGKVIDLKGDVRWINKTMSSQSSSNIGIAILDAPPEYLQLLESRT